MIAHPAYAVEPWAVRETELDLGVLEQAGSVFALANGHIGLRGNLDESEPQGLPGSYLNGFYEECALPYAEAGYGYPEDGQTVVNVTNGKIIRLLVDDEPFDVRSGTLRSHERVLDLRAGVLRRRVDWVSPAGQQVRVSSCASSRLCSARWPPCSTKSNQSAPPPASWSSQSSWPTSRCRPQQPIPVRRRSWAACCARSATSTSSSA